MRTPYETRLTPVIEGEVAAEPKGSLVKNIALFVAAPFIALAYIVAFPIVGIGLLAWTAVVAAIHHGAGRAVKRVALVVMAPLIGLAYVVLFPFVGLGMLAWIGWCAVRSKAEPPAYGRHGVEAAA